MSSMSRKSFVVAVCALFLFIPLFSNFICVLIPIVFSFITPDTNGYAVWEDFLCRNNALQVFLSILSFSLPAFFCFSYLAEIRKTEKNIVRLVNAPIVLSLIGTLGRIFQFVVEVILITYLCLVKKTPCWDVLPSSMLFTFLDSILAFTCAYFIMEILNRTFILRRIFPDGKISKLPGLKKPSIAVSFIAFYLGCIVFPLSFLFWTICNIWRNNSLPYDKAIILSVIFFIQLSLYLTILLMRFFKKPLEDLTKAAERISLGNYKEPLSVSSADELGILSDSFNEMQKSLAEKDFMRDTFGKIVTPQVRDFMLNNKVALGGESKNVTVLFCDIRSFTSLSEKLPSEKIVQMLNIYFTAMEKCISAYGGIINKYIGDCVMAIFGAPVENKNHAYNAYCAGLEMRSSLSAVNKKLVELGLPEIKNGIGLHSGFVTAGNIGAENRMEYTVIGDTVNVASRIEGLCKEYKKDFLMSEDSAKEIIRVAKNNSNKISLPRFLCESSIRGKEEKINLWVG